CVFRWPLHCFGSGGQCIVEQPFLELAARCIGHLGEANAGHTALPCPDHHAGGIDVALNLRKIEHKVQGTVHVQGSIRLDGHTAFTKIQNLGEVEHHSASDAVETGVGGAVHLLANMTAPIARLWHTLENRERRLLRSSHISSSTYYLARILA